MRRLSLSDFDLRGLQASALQDQYIAARTFLGYSAQYWADHFLNGDWEKNDGAVKKAISLCSLHLPASLAWFEIFQTLAVVGDVPESSISLSIASYFGLSEVVKQLHEEGADANAQEVDGWTPLHWASSLGHGAAVQQLLEAGADANAKEHNEGWTPLHWASSLGHDAAVWQLLEAGADANAKDYGGRMPLHVASENGHDTVVQQLLDAGADGNAKEEDGRTPLYWASQCGHNVVVQRLLEAGAKYGDEL
jgi:hypothetical protein